MKWMIIIQAVCARVCMTRLTPGAQQYWNQAGKQISIICPTFIAKTIWATDGQTSDGRATSSALQSVNQMKKIHPVWQPVYALKKACSSDAAAVLFRKQRCFTTGVTRNSGEGRKRELMCHCIMKRTKRFPEGIGENSLRRCLRCLLVQIHDHDRRSTFLLICLPKLFTFAVPGCTEYQTKYSRLSIQGFLQSGG